MVASVFGFLVQEWADLKGRYATYRRNAVFRKREVRLGDGAKLHPDVKIGAYTFIGRNVTIGRNCTEIGAFCSLALGATIAPTTHPTDRFSSSAAFYSVSWGVTAIDRKDAFNTQKTVLGNDVWVGCNAIVLPGVTVADGAVIGAGAVVTRDVGPYEIVAGVPARVIGKRFSEEVVEAILAARIYGTYSPETLLQVLTSSTLYDADGMMTDTMVRQLVEACEKMES